MMGVRKITLERRMRSFGTVCQVRKLCTLGIVHGRHSDYIYATRTVYIYSVLSSGFNMIDCTLSFIQNYSIDK
jgi:hypothetical protein